MKNFKNISALFVAVVAISILVFRLSKNEEAKPLKPQFKINLGNDSIARTAIEHMPKHDEFVNKELAKSKSMKELIDEVPLSENGKVKVGVKSKGD